MEYVSMKIETYLSYANRPEYVWSSRTWRPEFQIEDKDSGNTKIFHVIAWHTPQSGQYWPCHLKQMQS